jgi:hypothetical protein
MWRLLCYRICTRAGRTTWFWKHGSAHRMNRKIQLNSILIIYGLPYSPLCRNWSFGYNLRSEVRLPNTTTTICISKNYVCSVGTDLFHQRAPRLLPRSSFCIASKLWDYEEKLHEIKDNSCLVNTIGTDSFCFGILKTSCTGTLSSSSIVEYAPNLSNLMWLERNCHIDFRAIWRSQPDSFSCHRISSRADLTKWSWILCESHENLCQS